MPLLEITSLQSFLQIHLGTLRSRRLRDGKALSSSFIFTNERRLLSSWKPLNLPIKLHSDVRRSRIFINAVATFETESLVQKPDEKKDHNNSQVESANKDSEEMDERERLRRMRISKANKGKMPWNQGRKHSPETLQRIRERTRIALQNPKVKEKLKMKRSAHSDESKVKIGDAVRKGWQRRLEMLAVQKYCLFEWQNLIAEASRTGYAGQEELQWDSKKILKEQLEKEWLESVERRKRTRPIGCTRAPKSLEQRRKIATAIAAKWADPEYRKRVRFGLSRHHGTTGEVGRKPNTKRSSDMQSTKPNRPNKKASDTQNSHESKTQTKKLKNYEPQYKDLLASSKLEMIKKIRAQRAADTKKTEAIAQARLLIAQAEMAAEALELAAEKSSAARASLMETRKLLAEAIKSIEGLETSEISTSEMHYEEPNPQMPDT